MKRLNINYMDKTYIPTLYYICDVRDLNSIINDNILKRGYIMNQVNGKMLNIIYLTRFKKMNLNEYKEFNYCVIKLDKNKLSQNYKIQNYDFFIHSKQEHKPKSDIGRIKPVEFTEIILKDIKNIDKYILSIDFIDNSLLYIIDVEILKSLNKKNIKILNNGK